MGKNSLNFGSRRVKVVIDPANGATSSFTRKIYEMFPIDLEFINEESDGTFPNHHPDPCVEDNLAQLKKKVAEVNADVGLGFDGDGDRLAVIDETGKLLATTTVYPTEPYRNWDRTVQYL